jgi:rhamnosyltransferase
VYGIAIRLVRPYQSLLQQSSKTENQKPQVSARVSIIVPTSNAGASFRGLLEALLGQDLKGPEIIVIDSSSTDGTVETCLEFGISPVIIPREEFDHGGTRTMAAKRASGSILVFMTQDARPADSRSIGRLIEPFCQGRVAAAFGRQIPHEGASALARHLRLFNYPEVSYARTLEDCRKYGVKAAFLSNAFAAYRRSALEEIGWFKKGLVVSEDLYAGARLLERGYELRYVAEAAVFHSHEYSLGEEFRRYFDIGTFYGKEPWILELLGRPEGEGARFVLSQLSFLVREGRLHLVPESLLRAAVKFVAFRLGMNHRLLPPALRQRLSMRYGS